VAATAPFHAQQMVQSAPNGQVPDLHTLLSRVELQQLLAPQPQGLSVQVQQVARKMAPESSDQVHAPSSPQDQFSELLCSPHHFVL
jgi:hypothetical protein